MNLEDKTLLGSLAVNSMNQSYRTLRGVGSTSPLPALRLHRLTGRRGGQGGLKPMFGEGFITPDNVQKTKLFS
jgi:hypothetical protein